MNTSKNQVYHSHVSPQQAYMDLSKENMPFAAPGDTKTVTNHKRKGSDNVSVEGLDLTLFDQIDENVVRNRVAEHFSFLHDIQENERLRSELDRTTFSLNLYDEYKKQKKRRTR